MKCLIFFFFFLVDLGFEFGLYLGQYFRQKV